MARDDLQRPMDADVDGAHPALAELPGEVVRAQPPPAQVCHLAVYRAPTAARAHRSGRDARARHAAPVSAFRPSPLGRATCPERMRADPFRASGALRTPGCALSYSLSTVG